MLLSALLPFFAATAVAVAAASATAEMPDPIAVFYPRGDCQTGILEVEIFDRAKGAWGPHPSHPRVLADGCYQEDAGGLLNEIRVRCVDPEQPERRASAWVVGAEVFRTGIVTVCEPGPPLIRLTSPRAGEAIDDPSKLARVAGRVVLDPAGSQALASLGVENLRQGAAASRVDFSPDGRFEARVPLVSGSNQVRIHARLGDGREASAEFTLDFDPSRLREELLEAERQRMRRIRAQRGEVEIEAEAPPPRPVP